jgi:hypothetical protein
MHWSSGRHSMEEEYFEQYLIEQKLRFAAKGGVLVGVGLVVVKASYRYPTRCPYVYEHISLHCRTIGREGPISESPDDRRCCVLCNRYNTRGNPQARRHVCECCVLYITEINTCAGGVCGVVVPVEGMPRGIKLRKVSRAKIEVGRGAWIGLPFTTAAPQ